MFMERKATGGSVQVVAEEVKTSLAKRSDALGNTEEQALRMRHGISVETGDRLARAAGDNAELADELLLIEMQLLRARMRSGKAEGLPRAPQVPAPAPSPTKSKIVRALRRKR
jgi:hypothetical protein